MNNISKKYNSKKRTHSIHPDRFMSNSHFIKNSQNDHNSIFSNKCSSKFSGKKTDNLTFLNNGISIFTENDWNSLNNYNLMLYKKSNYNVNSNSIKTSSEFLCFNNSSSYKLPRIPKYKSNSIKRFFESDRRIPNTQNNELQNYATFNLNKHDNLENTNIKDYNRSENTQSQMNISEDNKNNLEFIKANKVPIINCKTFSYNSMVNKNKKNNRKYSNNKANKANLSIRNKNKSNVNVHLKGNTNESNNELNSKNSSIIESYSYKTNINNQPNINLNNLLIEDTISNRKSRFNNRNTNQNQNLLNNSGFYDITTRRRISVNLKSDYRLDINYKDISIHFNSKSDCSSEFNISRSCESQLVIPKTYILEDKPIDSKFKDNHKNSYCLRILIVDDEHMLRKSIIKVIKKFSDREK